MKYAKNQLVDFLSARTGMIFQRRLTLQSKVKRSDVEAKK